MTALAVGRSAAHGLQRERHSPGGQPRGNPNVGQRPEVIAVGDERVPQPGAEQVVQRAGGLQRGIDAAMSGRAPFQLRVGRPVHRVKASVTDLGLAGLQEVRRDARHAQVIAGQGL